MAKPERFEALDAWRGICALVVALEHLNVDSVLHRNAFVVHGFRFVDFFFVLSGFVIAHAYRARLQQGGAVRAFLIRRIGRLWPLHVVALGVLVGFELLVLIASHVGISLGHAAFTDRNTLAGIGAHLALIQGLGVFDQLTWNGPSWSISTEVFAYVLFAGLAALLPGKLLELVAGALVIGCAVVVVTLAPHGMGSTYDFGVFRCVFGFMTGVLVRSLHGRHPIQLGTGGELVVVAAVVAAVIWLPTDGPALLVTPLFALAVWVFAAESGALSRALRRAGPQALGAWSYSIYMVHVLVVVGILTAAMLATKYHLPVFARVDGVVAIVGPTWFTTLVIVGYVGLVIAISRFTYRHVELRGQQIFGRWAARAPR
ncbi:MAG: acyltransferase [Proteobacteria bacterium]|nr:acyltransferase [Pseudomonadota bacterium]